MAELKLKLERLMRSKYPKTEGFLPVGRSVSQLHVSHISGYSADQLYNVNKDLQKNLRNFVLAYLKEQPNDIIDYAAAHFKEIQQKRIRHAASIAENLDNNQSDDDDDESSSSFSDLDELNHLNNQNEDNDSRRSSVFSESYDPRRTIQSEDARCILPKTDAQRKRLLACIQNCIIFKDLEVEKLSEIVDAMYEKVVPAGEVIIEEGKEGDNFYVIEKGTYDVLKEGKQIRTLFGGSFGEMALLYSAPRNATIKAHTDGSLWVLDRKTFRNILQKHVLNQLAQYQDLVNCTPLFKNFNKYELMRVLEHLETREFERGTEILTYGEKSEGMYFIEEGKVSVSCFSNDEGFYFVHYLSNGDYFGEVELILETTTTAYVRAETDVKLAFISAENFKLYMGSAMEAMICEMQRYKSRDDYVYDKLNDLLKSREFKNAREDENQDDLILN